MKTTNELNEDTVTTILDKHGRDRTKLLTVFLDIQEASDNNFVSEQQAEAVARGMNIPLSEIYDVLTFYAMLNTEPRGKRTFGICRNVSCKFRGGDKLAQKVEEAAGIKMGETDPSGRLTIKWINCIGGCDDSPAIKIDDEVFCCSDHERAVRLAKKCLDGSFKHGEAGN